MDEIPKDTITIGHEAHETDYGDLKTFTLANRAVDVFSQRLHRFDVMDLYRLSRSAYLEGLTEGRQVHSDIHLK